MRVCGVRFASEPPNRAGALSTFPYFSTSSRSGVPGFAAGILRSCSISSCRQNPIPRCVDPRDNRHGRQEEPMALNLSRAARTLRSAFISALIFMMLGFGAATGPRGPERTTARKKTPVLLDTDIGDDIDDTWALALLLKSPELDLKLVVTDFGNTVYRAKIAAPPPEIPRQTRCSRADGGE